MKKVLAVVAASLAAAGIAHASGNPIQRDAITVRIDRPVFLGPTAACPAFRAHTRLLSESGVVVGSSLLCASSVTFDDPTATQIQEGILTLYLPGGAIAATATLVDGFGGYPNVTQTISGSVTAGTGVYRGASGTLAGGGTIVFDENGEPHPESTLVVELD
jgi:hypothetical protein